MVRNVLRPVALRLTKEACCGPVAAYREYNGARLARARLALFRGVARFSLLRGVNAWPMPLMKDRAFLPPCPLLSARCQLSMIQRFQFCLAFVAGGWAVAARYQGADVGQPQAIDVQLEEEAPVAAAGWGDALRSSSLAQVDQHTTAGLAAAVASQRDLRARIANLRGAGGSGPGPDAIAARGGGSLNAALRDERGAILADEVHGLLPSVAAGGRTARHALARLVALTAQPGAKAAMVSSGLVSAAETLLRRPSTDATTRRLSGSLLTLLSDLPGTPVFPRNHSIARIC